MQCCAEVNKIALAAGALSRQTSLSLWEFISYETPLDPTSFNAFGDSHPQNLLPRELIGVATTG